MPLRKQQERHGASTVEFAFCVPVLVVVIFAIVEYARALQLQQAVRQAAFEGARAGATLDARTSDVQNATNNIVKALGVTNATITITPNPLVYSSPTVTVTVTINLASNGWFTKFVTGKSVTSTISLDREVQAVSVTGS